MPHVYSAQNNFHTVSGKHETILGALHDTFTLYIGECNLYISYIQFEYNTPAEVVALISPLPGLQH